MQVLWSPNFSSFLLISSQLHLHVAVVSICLPGNAEACVGRWLTTKLCGKAVSHVMEELATPAYSPCSQLHLCSNPNTAGPSAAAPVQRVFGLSVNQAGCFKHS